MFAFKQCFLPLWANVSGSNNKRRNDCIVVGVEYSGSLNLSEVCLSLFYTMQFALLIYLRRYASDGVPEVCKPSNLLSYHTFLAATSMIVGFDDDPNRQAVLASPENIDNKREAALNARA